MWGYRSVAANRLFLPVLAVALAIGLYAISPNLPSWSCLWANVRVALASPQQQCWTECTSWSGDPCEGYSSCYNKNISCNGGKDQDGRDCLGCCFSCQVVCPPPPDEPPTITGTLNCSAWGSNGWCIGSETLDLSASDPQGATLLISGDLNGTPFSCPQGDTYSVCGNHLGEGPFFLPAGRYLLLYPIT